jgi:hypothetical protein
MRTLPVNLKLHQIPNRNGVALLTVQFLESSFQGTLSCTLLAAGLDTAMVHTEQPEH